MMPRSGYRIALTFIAALLALSFALSACGGGGGDSEALPTLQPGDPGEITQVLRDFVRLREDGTAEELAALFSVQCENQQATAQGIIAQWTLFKDAFDVEVDGIEAQDLQPETAMVRATGKLVVQDQDSSDVLASPPISMVKEGVAWKIATCGLSLPSLDNPISFQ